MKRRMLKILAITVVVAQIVGIGAFADIPNAFWAVSKRYTQAVTAKDYEKIISTTQEIEKLFEKQPLDKQKGDILAPKCDEAAKAAEKLENYDLAVEYLEKYIKYATFLGWKDGVKLAEGRLNHLDLMVEIYAEASAPKDIPFSNAKYEPKWGSYFGKTMGGDASNESAVLTYFEFFSENARSFDSLLAPYKDGKKIIEFAWNIREQNQGLKTIISGSADAYIKENLTYMAEIMSPVFLRFGGEMNVWVDLADPALYKQAFVKVAKMAKEIAPNVAMVFSPNDISNWNVDIDRYYPGDEWVDWVGMSSYTNEYFTAAQLTAKDPMYEAYYSNGAFANPIVKMRDIVEKYGDKKPIILTECGVANHVATTGKSMDDFAAKRVDILYRYVNMVFPEVKGIVYFDTQINTNGYVYGLEKSPKAAAAYKNATQLNSALIKSYGTPSKAYTKLSQFNEIAKELKLYTYVVLPGDKAVKCDYYLDGKLVKTATAVPYEAVLNLSSVKPGKHTVKVDIKGGTNYKKTKEYTFTMGVDGIANFTGKGLNANAPK